MKETTKAAIYGNAVIFLNYNGHTAELYPDYSGKAMYGSRTVGIVTNAPGPVVGYAIAMAMIEFCNSNESLGIRNDFNQIISYCTENADIVLERCSDMGLDKIYY